MDSFLRSLEQSGQPLLFIIPNTRSKRLLSKSTFSKTNFANYKLYKKLRGGQFLPLLSRLLLNPLPCIYQPQEGSLLPEHSQYTPATC